MLEKLWKEKNINIINMKSEKAYLKKIYVVEQTFNRIEDEVYEMNQSFTKKKVTPKKMKKIKNNKWNESE
jgi:hypothetical protein